MTNPYGDISTPCYVVEENLLRRNLSVIKDVSEKSGAEFILAFKAFALWKTFPIFREYIEHTTASSPDEAKLAYYIFGSKAHTYSPAYEEDTFGDILDCSSHITFNSLSQYKRFYPLTKTHPDVSLGLRINPEYSEIETELYNPCAAGSRFGVLASQLPETLPEGIKGFHCHNHCESSAEALSRSLMAVEEKFGSWFNQIEWLNLGGGHLVTREGYNKELLIDVLSQFRRKYPHLHIILEPGSAFAWNTGPLVAKVVDITENHGIKTAIMNVSFTCHMPDCLEMPYMPRVRGAETLEGVDAKGHETDPCVYRLGGNSCLSGDYMGYWRFERPLKCDDVIIFEDMIHYTTVKTNVFNGVHHPSIAIHRPDGTTEILRQYTYEDYRDRMD